MAPLRFEPSCGKCHDDYKVGDIRGGISVRFNIDQVEAALAITDVLTGAFNRRHLMERLTEELARASRYGRGLACIMFDLDHFKRVNDTHGHAAGDEVLRTVGAAVGKMLRASDFLGRYGGEEFVVVLPETDLSAATLTAEKLRSEIENLLIAVGEAKASRVPACLGVAYFEAASGVADAMTLVQQADAAMYRAKEAGRNRVEVGPKKVEQNYST